MDEVGRALIGAALVGGGATAVMDVWGLLRRRLFGLPLPDYALLGRWLAWMPRGRFVHRPIAATPAVRGEHALGWAAHYLIGMAFAGLLLAGWGLDWLRAPRLGPALGVGLVTVLAPWLLMQPGMGAGLFARRTPRPAVARLHSLLTHAVFGLGLWAGGWAVRPLLSA